MQEGEAVGETDEGEDLAVLRGQVSEQEHRVGVDHSEEEQQSECCDGLVGRVGTGEHGDCATYLGQA